MCFQQEGSAQCHQEVLSRSRPVAQETQFHLVLNSPPQQTEQDHLVPSLFAQVERLHYLKKQTVREQVTEMHVEEVSIVMCSMAEHLPVLFLHVYGPRWSRGPYTRQKERGQSKKLCQ